MFFQKVILPESNHIKLFTSEDVLEIGSSALLGYLTAEIANVLFTTTEIKPRLFTPISAKTFVLTDYTVNGTIVGIEKYHLIISTENKTVMYFELCL